MTRDAIVYLRAPATGATADQRSVPARKGIEIVAVVRDAHDAGRSGLAEALGYIAAGRATTLMTLELGAVAGSLRALIALFDWLAAAAADLVALDVDLDTASAMGRRAVVLLREVERWEREVEPGRPPRGRPGLAAREPRLGRRIAAMRKGGLSLQAIADALNADGVPTQRGGARWRPSSVQAALGYRRPRPPVPGAPPPPPPRAPGPPTPPGRRPPRGAGPPRRGGPRG
jgi:DNA invertase Pin-like site-specific DNA recombinase